MRSQRNEKSLFRLNATILQVTMISVLSFGNALAMPLTNATRCHAGNASYGVDVVDVKNNHGIALECWGAFKNNDPGPNGGVFRSTDCSLIL